MCGPRVGIVMGSDSDWTVVAPARDILDQLGVVSEVRVLSAHRTPHQLLEYGASAADRGLGVLIGAAGGAAHLPGMLASVTVLPVIGLPVPLSRLDGMDSLLSIVQMPAGIPVATVAIGMPAGICTIESSESIPSSRDSGTGRPITGRTVTEASMPGRCAAPPAAPIRTPSPRSAAEAPYSSSSWGVRWAESTRTSETTPSWSRMSRAGATTVQSESLPITMPTRGPLMGGAAPGLQPWPLGGRPPGRRPER